MEGFPLHKIQDLGNDIQLIDLMDLQTPERTGAYILGAEELTVIETSASPSIPHLIEGMQELNINLEDIKHIIVTHVHLDHAGGTGLFLEQCPEAKVYVHPRGKRHLADPSKLIAGARMVYGDDFDQLFNPIVPIDEKRLVAMEEGQSLDIGGRLLTFYDTPGHAKHHFSIHDSKSNGFFTGDTIGVFYPNIARKGYPLVLPSTSPNQFNPEAMLSSVEKIESLQPQHIFFGHYGEGPEPKDVFTQIRYWLPIFTSVADDVFLQGNDIIKMQEAIQSELLEQVKHYLLTAHDVELSAEDKKLIGLDLNVCTMGMIDRLQKVK